MTSPVLDQAPAVIADTWERGESQQRRGANKHRLYRLLLLVAGYVSMVLVWQWVSYYLSPAVLPGPLDVAERMWEILEGGDFLDDFGVSVGKTFAGFAIAAVVGAPIGYLMGRFPFWKAFFHDGVTVAGTIPGLVYAVMALIIFGLSPQGPILAVALVSIPYVALNVAEGISGVDQGLVKMSQVFHRTPRQIRRHVLIPTVVPFVFAAIRMSFAVAWKVEALTEVFGGRNGVGFQIRLEYQLFSITGVLAWMFLFVAFMLVIERLVLAKLESRLLSWRPAERIGS